METTGIVEPGSPCRGMVTKAGLWYPGNRSARNAKQESQSQLSPKKKLDSIVKSLGDQGKTTQDLHRNVDR